MNHIREERSVDTPAVRELLIRAFGQPNEADLAETLRSSVNFIPALSLVAEENGELQGYILFTIVTIDSSSEQFISLALAPLAVRPERQNRGTGSLLVREGLKICKKLGFGSVVLLGHPEYYPRFGFIPASQKNIHCPFPVPDEAFMVYEIYRGALDGIHGTVNYPPAFHKV